jgi:REP element-mobilizing transposase RayT
MFMRQRCADQFKRQAETGKQGSVCTFRLTHEARPDRPKLAVAVSQVGFSCMDRQMPRQPRLDLAGVPQHIVQRGNDRQPCFFQDIDHVRYLDELREICQRDSCAVHAYVLMTNHVHLLMTPSAQGQVARVMQSLGRRCLRRVNDRYRLTGTLWEGRYMACLVDSGLSAPLLPLHRAEPAAGTHGSPHAARGAISRRVVHPRGFTTSKVKPDTGLPRSATFAPTR